MEEFDLQTEYPNRSRPGRRNKRCNILIICLLLLVGLAGFVLYSYTFEHMGSKEEEVHVLKHVVIEPLTELESSCEEDLCLTKECVTTAARLLRFMDDTKSPCNDFYEYACGNYAKLQTLRAGEYVYTPHTEVKDNMMIYIKKMFDRADEFTQTQSFKKARAVYSSCTYDVKRELDSVQPLLQFLNASGIDWPILDRDEDLDEVSWTTVLREMAKYGIETLFKPKFTSFENNETVLIEVDCSVTVFGPDVYLSPSERKNELDLNFYEEVFSLMFHHLGFKRKDGKKMFQDILELETELSRAMTQVSKERTVDCSRPCSRAYCIPCKSSSVAETYPLSELHKQQLKDIWSGLLHRRDAELHIKSVCDGNLQAALTVINSAPKKTVLNYIAWRAISYLTQFLSYKQQGIFNYYADRLVGVPLIPISMWRECSDLIRREMGTAIFRPLIEAKYLSEENHKEMQKRFSAAKDGFKFLFHLVPWLTNETIADFSAKVEAVSLQIGIPEEMKPNSAIDELYSDLDVDSDNTFFANILNLFEFKTAKRYAALLTHDIDNRRSYYFLDHSPLGTDAKYDYEKNEIVVDFGLLLTPLMKFGDGLPRYLEHGQNVILARELSHALDSVGIQYDRFGNRSAMDSLPLEVKQKFYNFVTCVLQQNPSLPSNLADDAIADLGSLFIAASEFELHLLSEPQEDTVKQLPGVSLTRKQIFFVQSAQTFCEALDEYWMASYGSGRRHSRDRLNTAISNMVNFAPAFDCEVDEPMNPSKKCNLLM